MSEEFLYEEILREFHREKVKYLIVGGVALNLHGIPRATFDLDIIIDLEPENIKKVYRILKENGYCLRVPVEIEKLYNRRYRQRLKKDKHLIALNFYKPEEPLEEVDIILAEPEEFKAMFKGREELEVDDIKVHVIGLDDLIRMKARSNRGKDKEDLKNLNLLKELNSNGGDEGKN